MVNCVKCETEIQCAEGMVPVDGLIVYKADNGNNWPYVYVCVTCCGVSNRIEVHNNPKEGFSALRGSGGYPPFARVNRAKFGFVQLLEWLVAHTELRLEVPDMFELRTAWIALEIPT